MGIQSLGVGSGLALDDLVSNLIKAERQPREKRLKDVLKNNFDDVISLFSDSQNGVAKKLADYIEQYTRTGGLLTTRERSVKDEKELVTKERESFELQMLQFESI